MRKFEMLKEVLEGKELTVLKMDNIAIDLLGVDDNQSILNGDLIYYAFENMSHTYEIEDESINVNFELIEENEYKQDFLIKVTNIELI